MLRHAFIVASLLSAGITFTSFAQVSNADFEDWNGNTPSNWSTIDSGLTVSPSTTPVYSGSTAAQVTVSTSNQSATDLRQAVSVQNGQQYTFSTWVYHTEGSLAARLYVDGYHNYSNETLTGQWQQISYSYTASVTGQIEVGLRFYDRSGFDGEETVYVDNFAPSASGGGSCSKNAGTFALTTDNYGGETSWEIKDDAGIIKVSGGGYDSNSSTSEAVCLSDGDYTLIVTDSYGDGICCSYGNGSYSLTIEGEVLATGGQFGSEDTTAFTLGTGGGSTGGSDNLDAYYSSAEGLTGSALKTALYDIIKGHSTQSYSGLWTFYSTYGRDSYYENDGTILDIYSENPAGNDAYTFTSGSDQCGSYGGEGDCYNREHSFPRAWFGGSVSPMNTDIHHIFATDGYVNGRRSSYPYGEVSSVSYLSDNGSKLGSGTATQGYTNTVFEPIDEFKGDIARAYFYMATRYENVIAGWENNSSYGDAVLNGSNDQVFESWFLTLLLQWHADDPVSQYETDRNDAAYSFQGNRNPFIDHPELASAIWGN